MNDDDRYKRSSTTDDKTVEAVGKMSEAMEWVERARGHLFELHQMMGRADFLFEDAAKLLHKAGHTSLSEQVDKEVVGRNILPGRWTFQIVDEFQDTYYQPIANVEKQIRDHLMDGKRHVFEAELKEKRRSSGEPGHSSRPNES